MTTKEAVQVARIVVHHATSPGKLLASFLLQFPEVDLIEFFNETDSFIDDHLHDQIFAGMEFLERSGEAYFRRRR